MNGYTFQVDDPYTGQASTVLVFATDEITACSKMRAAVQEVNGAGLQVNFHLTHVTKLRLAA